jgi:hypothetical protein
MILARAFSGGPDSRRYILYRDAAVALGVTLLSVVSKMYPPNAGALRKAWAWRSA